MDSKELKNKIASGTIWNDPAKGINMGFVNAGGLGKGIITLPMIENGEIITDDEGKVQASDIKCFIALWKHKTKQGWYTVQFTKQAVDAPEQQQTPAKSTVEPKVNEESIPLD